MATKKTSTQKITAFAPKPKKGNARAKKNLNKSEKRNFKEYRGQGR